MTNQPSDPASDISPERTASYRTPRWVKVFGIILIVVVLLVVVVLATGIGGEHGPGRHMPSGDAGSNPPAASVTEDLTASNSDLSAHTPPVEHSEHSTQQP